MAKNNRFGMWYRVFYDIFFNTSWYALNMLKINIKEMLFCLENRNKYKIIKKLSFIFLILKEVPVYKTCLWWVMANKNAISRCKTERKGLPWQFRG